MNYHVIGIPFSSELYHHGIKGQKWGVRRYQNPDGSLTRLGMAMYGSKQNFENKQKLKEASRERTKSGLAVVSRIGVLPNITAKGREKTKTIMSDYNKKDAKYKSAKEAYSKSSKKKMSKEAMNARNSVAAHQAHVIKQGARLAMTAVNAAAFVSMSKIAADPNTNIGMRAVSGFLAGANAAAMMGNALKFDMNRGKKFN